MTEHGEPYSLPILQIGLSCDPKKRRSNQRKHKVDLPECESAFDAPMLTREDPREYYGELRLVRQDWANGRVVVWFGLTRE